MALGGGSFLAGLWGNAASNASASPMNAFTLAGNYVAPTGLINPEQAITLLHIGAIDTERFQHIRRFAGQQGDAIPANQLRLTRVNAGGVGDLSNSGDRGADHANDIWNLYNKPFPSADELNTMYNRGLISQSLYYRVMDWNTLGEPGFQRAYEGLRYQIPGPSDLIAFAVRDAFSPEIVKEFGYNKELPIAILPWMEKQGLHQQIGIPLPPGSTTTDGVDNREFAQWFDIYWWSHWQLPSAGQGYEMLHRLYYQSPHGPAPGVTKELSFNTGQLSLLLKANDYPDFWRKKLEFISYSPLTRVDVRRMYDTGVADDDTVYHAYRAIGYDDSNAERLLQFTKKLKYDRDTKKYRDGIYKELHDTYALGGMDRDTVINRLKDIDYTLGQATLILRFWDMQRTKANIKEYIATLKQGYLLGSFTRADTRNGLANLGIQQDRLNQYLNLWDKIKDCKRKFLSAATNIKHYLAGMIDKNILNYHLFNLNFDTDAVRRMVLYADYEHNKMVAQEIAKAQKEAAKAAKATIDALLKPYSDANIKTFFKKGVISVEDVYKVLRLRGWLPGPSRQWMESYLEIESEDIPSDEDITDDSEEETTNDESEVDNAEI